MDRCPKCHRFGVEIDILSNIYKCLWKRCDFMTSDYSDITKAKHPIKFQKFIDSIRKKTELC